MAGKNFDEARFGVLDDKIDKGHKHGWDCWCNPRYEVRCDDCDGDGCWKCNGGWIEATREEAIESDEPTVMIHNAE